MLVANAMTSTMTTNLIELQSSGWFAEHADGTIVSDPDWAAATAVAHLLDTIVVSVYSGQIRTGYRTATNATSV